MREESCSLQQQCVATTEASSISKQRKKRKWDQPDESLVSRGVALSGMLPTGSVGFSGVSLPGAVSVSCAPSTNSVNHASIQASVVQQQAAVLVQKLNQPKIQEDLIIAREIIINDADPAMRYKLTKRLTQEEIQKSTGAVVITRGKYRPPNAAPDGEKPLYLHISAGTHIKETAERILAVDRAAAMVEDMLKQVSQPLSTCVYLGFDADPSVNIAARIRGPNDQYINHIINETGATLVLRGRGSGYLDTQGEGDQQPLHLLLSSNNQKSLEDAKLLAENLLDTISRECGANRISCKVYNAVPPPQQLLVGIQSSGTAMHSNLSSASSMASFAATSLPSVPALSVVAPVVPTAFSYGQVVQPGASYPLGHAQTNGLPCSQSSLTACTSYSAYAGLYPQATPLQQVALTLRQSSPISSTVSPATSATREMPKSLTESEKRKRKFQESPASLKGVAISQQVLSLTSMKLTGQYYGSLYWTVFTGFASSVGSAADEAIKESDRQDLRCPSSLENNRKDPISLKSLLPPPLPRSSSSMPNPPKSMLAPPSPQPKSMHPRPPPPPPPPKFDSPVSVNTANDKDKFSNGSSFPTVPDTLVRLMEYGDDDDDTDAEECDNESCTNVAKQDCPSKPFWAV